MNDRALEAAKRLAAAGIASARLDARLLWQHAGGDDAGFDAAILRRLAHEPVAYITGHKEFWSLDFDVGSGVLVPRPDSETLIEQALLLAPPRRIADLGAGSGALLVAALTEFPEATGIGLESSPAAHAYAARNAARHVGARAEIRLADWSQAPGRFDLVLCNPPYIPSGDIAGLDPDVRDHEPRAALDGGPDGLNAYRGLAELLPRLLEPGGHALLEIGAGQGAAMAGIFRNSGLELVKIAPDLAQIPRCVVLAAPA